MTTIEIGRAGDQPVHLDLGKLVDSRMLLQANSGGGKSWAIRRLLEQSYGHIQQLVIDPEDEFPTLREEYDYVLAGRDGGDCPAEPSSAKLLAARFLELGVNGIFGIYELKPAQRITFVRRFLEGLVNAPRRLWHPVLVVIDEAHVFCPEKGHAESEEAVIDLMSRGRKRGYGTVLATQRIAKLNKDAAAEANNKLIGRASLDIDKRRAADELGFAGREDRDRLRHLDPGEFFAFGPAISHTIQLVTVGPVKTSHPKAGQRAAPPPPAPERMAEVLAKLQDVPADHRKAEQSQADLEAQLRSVRAELGAANRKINAGVGDAGRERHYQRGLSDGRKESAREIAVLKRDTAAELARAAKMVQDARKRFAKIRDLAHDQQALESDPGRAVMSACGIKPGAAPTTRKALAGLATAAEKSMGHPGGRRPTHVGIDIGRELPTMVKGERRMLDVLVNHHPVKFTRPQWGTLAGVKYSGGTFKTYLGRLRARGLLDDDGVLYGASDQAMRQYGDDVEPPQTAEEVQERWLKAVGPKAAGRLLAVLLDVHPDRVPRDQLAELCGLEASGGTFKTYLGRLRTNHLIVEYDEGIGVAAMLFFAPHPVPA